MSFVVYLAVLLVAASSVLFGLDWLTAPLPPMPQPTRVVHATAPPAVKAKQDAKRDAKLSPIYPASPAPPKSDATGAASAMAGQTATAQTSSKCDIDACTDAYYSFRVSDCTYQPNYGPRRLCTKGTVRPMVGAAAAAQARASCNITTCERAYRSFAASDCTYQPSNGPRRLCVK